MLIDTSDLAGVDWADQTALPTGQLEQLLEAANQEVTRRAVIANAPAAVDQLNQQVLEAEGRTPGGPWRQPGGAFNAYPQGWTVTHKGKTWESLIPANVREPGETADPQSYRWWKDLAPPADTDAWNPNGKAYAVGAVVTYQGASYRCLQPHTSQPGWTPAAVPALWTKIST